MSFDLTPASLSTALAGLTYMADGDSSGVVQSGGSGFGVDYTASQLWHAQMGARLGVASHTNRHVNSSMAMDVAYRWNSTGHASFWTPNAFEFVTVHIGGNDFKHWNSAAGLRGYEHNLNAIVALSRMASRVQASAGTSTGTWSNTGTSGTSGAARHTTAPGATRTLSWSGPNATLLLLANRDGSGSPFSYTVDGGPVQTGTTLAQAAQNPVITGTYGLVPVDLRGYGSGSHSVTITHAGTSGQPLVVDSLIVHATNPASVPYLLLAPPPDVPAELITVAFDPPLPAPEDLEVFAERFANVQAAWADDGKVSQFLPDAYNVGVWAQFDSTMVINDGYHFNLKGQTLQAKVLGDSAVRTFPGLDARLLRHNLDRDPRFTATPTSSRVSVTPAELGTGIRLTVTSLGAAPRVDRKSTPFTPGSVYTCSVEGRSPTGTIAFNIVYRDSTGTAIQQSIGQFQPIIDGRASATSEPAPTTAASMDVWVGHPNNTPIGDWIEIDRLLIEPTPHVRSYFDGDTPGARWLGAPNASPSVGYLAP